MTFKLVKAHCDTVKDEDGVLLPSTIFAAAVVKERTLRRRRTGLKMRKTS